MFDLLSTGKLRTTGWPEHDRSFVHPLAGGLGLVALVASLVYGLVSDVTTTAAFVGFALLVLPVLLGLGNVVHAVVSAFR